MPLPDFAPAARPAHPGPFDASTMQPVPLARVLAVLDHYRSTTLYPEYRDALSAAIRVVELIAGDDPHAIVVETSRRAANQMGGDVDRDDAETMVRRANRVVCRLAGVAVPR